MLLKENHSDWSEDYESWSFLQAPGGLRSGLQAVAKQVTACLQWGCATATGSSPSITRHLSFGTGQAQELWSLTAGYPSVPGASTNFHITGASCFSCDL